MRVEASGFTILGLRGPFTGSGRVFFKLFYAELFCAEESTSFLALQLQALGCYKIRGTYLRHRFISLMYSLFAPSEGLCWAPIWLWMAEVPQARLQKPNYLLTWVEERSLVFNSSLNFLSPQKTIKLWNIGTKDWSQRSYPELKATWVGAIACLGTRSVGMFVKHWWILTCLLLKIMTLAPGWSSGTVVYCQKPVCSFWVRQYVWYQPQLLHVNSGWRPFCFCIQPLRTNLQRISCMLKPRSVWIIFLPIYFPTA